MNKAFDSFLWENYPSTNTPLGKSRLNKINSAVDEIDNRVLTLDSVKFDNSEAQGLFKDVSLDSSTGIITFTMVNGATKTIDTLLEKIAINFSFDPMVQKLIIYLEDGTTKLIDLSALITQYEFLNTETIAFQVSNVGKISAIIKEGSIQEKHLRPDYLADIKIESANAELSKNASAESARESAKSAEESKNYSDKSQEIFNNFQQSGSVNGVKGNAESAYRTGNVNITPENIGAPSKEYMEEHFAPDYVSRSRGIISSKGWYRIAQAKGGEYGASCVVSIKRSYNSPAPEYQKVQFVDSYRSNKIIPIVSFTGNDGRHLFTKIRKVYDAVNSIAYIEIYQAMDTSPNGVLISISDALNVYIGKWEAIEPAPTQETVEGINVLASLELPANFDSDYLARKDGSNVNNIWDNLIAGKALRDGDGNSFKDTYALKDIYGDDTVNMGRIDGSNKGEGSFAFGSGVKATGKNSFAIGYSTYASGYFSVSEGCDTLANDNYSHAGGYHTRGDNISSCVFGKYNKQMQTGGTVFTQSGDVFVIGNGTGESSRSNALRVKFDGSILGTKAFQSGGADYAEFIKPWADGNLDNEDRVGYMVTVKGGLLYKAQPGDYVAGITSGNPSVIGNADEDYYWKYERDEFNRIVMEDVPELAQKVDEDGNPVFDKETHEPIMEETGNIILNARMKLAEDYDPSLQQSYIPRAERPEWDYVGMVGVLPVRDDGTCLPGNFCKCGFEGIATAATKRDFDTFYVIERISDNVVSVVLRG